MNSRFGSLLMALLATTVFVSPRGADARQDDVSQARAVKGVGDQPDIAGTRLGDADALHVLDTDREHRALDRLMVSTFGLCPMMPIGSASIVPTR